MGFPEAVRTVLRRYAVFSGRSRRSEYWWFNLFTVGVSIVMRAVDHAVGSTVLGNLVSLALFLPGLGVSIRRLHDTSHSGWWYLLALLPIIGWIILLVWYCRDSDAGANNFGPSPKGAPYEAAWPPPSAPSTW